jgi:hypothetical protein
MTIRLSKPAVNDAEPWKAGDGESVPKSWARKRDRRMGARKFEARQHTPGLEFPPIYSRGRFAAPTATVACQGFRHTFPIPGPRRDTPWRIVRRTHRSGAASLDAVSTESRGDGVASRSPSLARDRVGRQSVSDVAIGWVEIRGLACVAWPRISGHPSHGHACEPRMAIDLPRRRPFPTSIAQPR